MKTLFLKLINMLNLFPLFNRYTRNTATIFMLHHIVPGDSRGQNITSAGLLRRYFEYLKRHKYNVLSLSQYIDALINHKETYKTVVFTVDDGYKDFYLYAYPEFKKYNYPATIFLTTDFIGGNLFLWWDKIEYILMNTAITQIEYPRLDIAESNFIDSSQRSEIAAVIVNRLKKFKDEDKLEIIDDLINILNVDISGQPKENYSPLSWDDINEMKKHGIDFHPHTKTHPIMSRVSANQKRDEILIPRNLIEVRLNSKANIFCYPNGGVDDFDNETIEILKSTDYIGAVTGIVGFNSTKNDTDMFRLSRFGIPDNIIWFKQYISGLEYFKQSGIR